MDIFQNQRNDFPDFHTIAGVDEAGRGPLAGPLVVASVILKDDIFHADLNDSKKLSEKKRKILFDWVISNSLSYAIEVVPVVVIDRVNILQATLLGMKSSVDALFITPNIALYDGNFMPHGMQVVGQAVIRGDSRYACIAAASILAKVTRDDIMIQLHQKYPEYGFITHKGYPTKKHIEMMQRYGVTPEHRMSYQPVMAVIRR
jgi:ribonuclease HII